MLALSNITNVTEELLFCHGLRFATYKQSRTVTHSVISAIALNTVIGAFSAVANSLMIFVVWKNDHLQTRINTLFTYLAITDALVGTCPIPMSAAFRIYQAKGVYYCNLGVAWAFSAYLLCLLSATAICVISADRFIATFYPMAYRRSDYPRKRNIFLFALYICWCIVLVFVLLRLITFLVFNGIVVIVLVATLSSGAYCYGKIVFKLRKNSHLKNDRRKQLDDSRIKRQCLTAGLINVALLVTYFPRLVATLIFFFEKEKRFELVYLSGVWSESFIYLNSAINPMLYFWRLKNVRAAVIEIIPNLTFGNRVQSYSTQIKMADLKERYTKRCSYI